METTIEAKLNTSRLVSARGEMSMANAARKLGISRQRLWKYEKGHDRVPSEVLICMCRLYERPAEFFFTS